MTKTGTVTGGQGQSGQPTREPFHVLAKPIGAVCNLRCEYCYYLEKGRLYPSTSDFRMPHQVLDAFVHQYIQANPAPVVSFGWQGGEPTLLGIEFFREALRLQKQHCPTGKRIENAIQTNGTLLDDEWCAFLRENRFLVGLSIDGPREMHNAYRVDRSGRGTFDRVLAALRLLRKHQVAFNVLTVVQTANAPHPVEAYRFFRDEGVEFIQFIPLVRRADRSSTAVTDATPAPEAFGRFLCGVFDEWVKRDIGKVFVQTFDVSLACWLGLPAPLCVHSETCGRALLLEHNGDLYACDHFVFPENRLGNILTTPLGELANAPQQQQFGRSKRDALPQRCRRCDVLFACRGGCLKDRFVPLEGEEPPLNYLCEGYRLFFRHIGPAMKRMAAEMKQREAAQQAQARQPAAAPRRNDPCPCGSGRKYKHCCGRRAAR